MRGIILDTNFLMLPFTQGVDVFEELVRVCDFPFELFVVDRTIEELKGLEGNGKDKKAAKLALSLIENKGIGIIETSGKGHVDDIIVEVALKKGYLVASQDKGLRRDCSERDLPRIFLRQKKYLVVEK